MNISITIQNYFQCKDHKFSSVHSEFLVLLHWCDYNLDFSWIIEDICANNLSW